MGQSGGGAEAEKERSRGRSGGREGAEQEAERRQRGGGAGGGVKAERGQSRGRSRGRVEEGWGRVGGGWGRARAKLEWSWRQSWCGGWGGGEGGQPLVHLQGEGAVRASVPNMPACHGEDTGQSQARASDPPEDDFKSLHIGLRLLRSM